MEFDLHHDHQLEFSTTKPATVGEYPMSPDSGIWLNPLYTNLPILPMLDRPDASFPSWAQSNADGHEREPLPALAFIHQAVYSETHPSQLSSNVQDPQEFQNRYQNDIRPHNHVPDTLSVQSWTRIENLLLIDRSA
jgi:hypothetical protein